MVNILCHRSSYRKDLAKKNVKKYYRVLILMCLADIIVYNNSSPESVARKVC